MRILAAISSQNLEYKINHIDDITCLAIPIYIPKLKLGFEMLQINRSCSYRSSQEEPTVHLPDITRQIKKDIIWRKSGIRIFYVNPLEIENILRNTEELAAHLFRDKLSN